MNSPATSASSHEVAAGLDASPSPVYSPPNDNKAANKFKPIACLVFSPSFLYTIKSPSSCGSSCIAIAIVVPIPLPGDWLQATPTAIPSTIL